MKTKQRFGARVISDTLRGKLNERTQNLGFNELSVFGLMKDEKKKYINEMINELERMDYVRFVGAGYPIIKVTDAGWRVLRGEEKGMMIQTELLRTSSHVQKPKEEETIDDIRTRELFEALRELRAELAGKRGVPAYVIFSDAALRDMCLRLPTTDEDFLAVNGVGTTKLERYGEQFIKVITDYIEKNKQEENDNSYTVEAIRASGKPEAYAKWEDDDIAKLQKEYAGGLSIKEMANAHGRTEGAIRARLKKEGIIF